MENLIPVVNKLQDVFGAIGTQVLDLPQIVVVGSQSSGKSSVLESIVGRDFLPRGSGIVTRRPLVLQLYSIAPSVDDGIAEEWGEFLHIPGKKFYDFEEIRTEIQKETDRLTGRNKGISNQSINLKVFSPHVLNLTLVDLPGITRVPTGDQPENVEEQIRSMCLEFIANPNAIILAVSAANQDLTNSDGLSLAKSVDPEGDRTIGVLTKVDIMDAGTDCMDVVCNRIIPLKKGYIAVKNRSQRDIQENLPIRKGLQKEMEYFQTHPRYRTVLSKCGTENLAIALNQILMRHIRDCLPDFKSKVQKMLDDVQGSIDSLGETAGHSDKSAQAALLLRLLSNFVHNISCCIDGKAAASTTLAIDINELYGGARISYIFNEMFGNRLRALDPFDGLDDNDIRTAIANANGTRPSLFVPEISFDLLVRRQIARLEQPGLQCVDYVFDEMQRMALQCETPELSRFPELRERTFEIVNAMLRSCLKPTQKMICSIIQVELAYINTSHPDFIGGKQAIAHITKKLNQQQPPQQPPSHIVGHSQQGLSHDRAGAGGGGGGPSPNEDANMKAGNMPLPPPGAPGMPPNSPLPPSQQAQLLAQQQQLQQQQQQQQQGGGGFFSMFSKAAPSTPAPPPQSSAMKASAISGGTSEGLIKLPQVPDNVRVSSSTASTDWGRRETEIIKTLISSYFDIVKKTFMDMVPKTIMRFLVNEFREKLQTELVSNLYRETILPDLLRETEDIESKRKACLESRETLRRALDIVNEVRSMSLPTTAVAASRMSSIGAGGGVGGSRPGSGGGGTNMLDADLEEESKFVSRRGKR